LLIYFVLDGIAKSTLTEITNKIAFIVRKERLDYATFLDICQRVRKKERHVAADSPAPVPPSDAHLPDDQRPLRRSDPADSGHESKKSLEVYQHLSLESVDKAYQDAVQSVRIQRDFCGTFTYLCCANPKLS
jgi:hypothetical protein